MKIAILEPLNVSSETLQKEISAAVPQGTDVVAFDTRPRDDAELVERSVFPVVNRREHDDRNFRLERVLSKTAEVVQAVLLGR